MEMCLLASSKIDSSTAHHLTNYEDIVWMTSSEIAKRQCARTSIHTIDSLIANLLHASNFDESEDIDLQEYTEVNEGEISNN